MILQSLYIIVALVVVLYAIHAVARSRNFQVFGGLTNSFNIKAKKIALTFDDGPSPGELDEVLEILDQERVKATFFFIGKKVEMHQDSVRKAVKAGHQIGNHGYSHYRLIFRRPSVIKVEVVEGERAINAAINGCGVLPFRPPYCKKLLVLPLFLWISGRHTYTWDLEPDTVPRTPKEIVEYVLTRVRPGSIILLHAMSASRRGSITALPMLIRSLKLNGYEFLTLYELESEALVESLP